MPLAIESRSKLRALQTLRELCALEECSLERWPHALAPSGVIKEQRALQDEPAKPAEDM
jgi:hypothetical protein